MNSCGKLMISDNNIVCIAIGANVCVMCSTANPQYMLCCGLCLIITDVQFTHELVVAHTAALVAVHVVG